VSSSVPEPDRDEVYDEERAEPVVRDKRRIDPETGQLREPVAATPPPAAPAAAPEPSAAEGVEPPPAEGEVLNRRVAELTDDLQRLSAEFANYRRRMERDREAMTVNAAGIVLTGLLPVLDDIERARSHGDLEGSFKAVGEAVEKVVATLGLTSYGEAGEPFDPNVHEALVSQPSAEVTEPTVSEVYARGYRLGDRVLRAAQVVVAEPG
jgi:molecular chaperone GrpE